MQYSPCALAKLFNGPGTGDMLLNYVLIVGPIRSYTFKAQLHTCIMRSEG